MARIGLITIKMNGWINDNIIIYPLARQFSNLQKLKK